MAGEAAVSSKAAELARLLRESRSTVALTGAGISVPSGIPDFRSPGTGIWENVDPFEVATIDAFHRDTKRFWDFYRPRFEMLGDKRPNPAHAVLADPTGIVEGTGKRIRHVKVRSMADVERPALRALIEAQAERRRQTG